MRRYWWLLIIVVTLSACSSKADQRVQVSPLPAQSAPVPTVPATDPDRPTGVAADADWMAVSAGIEWREIDVGVSSVQIVRIDPAAVRIRVGYDRGAPGRVSEWAAALEPIVVINGGYFDDQGRATALTIFDGVVEGASYDGFGGMLAVDTAGSLSLRSLRDEPYDSSEPLAQALQSTPLLVQNGEPVAQPNDDGDRARRTVVALDGAGRLLIIVNGWPTWTLTELSRWLVQQDLDLTTALNLDGGSSTGLVLNTPDRQISIDSLVRVPQVLLVERR